MTHKRTAVAALCLMLLSAVPALPQAEINPDHFPDPPAAQMAVIGSAEVSQAEANSAELDEMAAQVEQAREEAASAGISLGDGAGPAIDAYRAQAQDFEQLKARLNGGDVVVAKSR